MPSEPKHFAASSKSEANHLLLCGILSSALKNSSFWKTVGCHVENMAKPTQFISSIILHLKNALYNRTSIFCDFFANSLTPANMPGSAQLSAIEHLKTYQLLNTKKPSRRIAQSVALNTQHCNAGDNPCKSDFGLQDSCTDHIQHSAVTMSATSQVYEALYNLYWLAFDCNR